MAGGPGVARTSGVSISTPHVAPHVVWNPNSPDTVSVSSSLHSGRSAIPTDVKAFAGSDISEGYGCSEQLVYDERAAARWQCLRAAVLAAVTLVLAAVALAASHSGGGEHPVIYVCYAAVAVLLVQYGPLQYLGVLPPHSEALLAALVAWLLCVLLTLSAPGRMHWLFKNDPDSAPEMGVERCEEGATALWLAMILCSVAAFVRMSAGAYMVLAQLVCLQYVVLGFALPREECSDVDFGEGSAGPLLGMSPMWASVVQLYAIAALLMVMQYQLAVEFRTKRIVFQFQQQRSDAMMFPMGQTPSSDYLGDGVVIRGSIETILDDIDHEDRKWREFLHQVAETLPRAPCTSQCWAYLMYTLMDKVEEWREALRIQAAHLVSADTKDLAVQMQVLAEADDVNVEAVSQFMSHAMNETIKRPVEVTQSQSSARTGSVGRGCLPLKTVIGLSTQLGIGDWDFDAIGVDKERDHHVLQDVGFEVLRCFPIVPRESLTRFLNRLEASYIPNPYHSHIHAADMANSFLCLASKSGLWTGSGMPDFALVSMIVAALGHDVGHFGRNNHFLVNSRHDFAVTYNDRSPLESYHASTLIRLMESASDGIRLLEQLSVEQVAKSRNMIVSLILATDTQKHLEDLAAFRLRINADTFDPLGDVADQMQTLAILFRAADIGHSAKHWVHHLVWSHRITEEFHAQGDEEKQLGLKVSPLCEREGFRMASAQVGFIQFICLPTWRELARFEDSLERCRLRAGTPSFSDSGLSNRGVTPSKTKSWGRRSSGASAASLNPGSQDGKVRAPQSVVPIPGSVPAITVKETSFDREVSPFMTANPSLRRLNFGIAENCVLLCEENFQAWKVQVEVDRTASEVTPSVRGSRKLTNPGGQETFGRLTKRQQTESQASIPSSCSAGSSDS